MLWTYIREKMLTNPHKRVSEDDASMSYEEIVVFAESFAAKLNMKCYAVYCQSEFSAYLAILSCFAANVTVVPMSFEDNDSYCHNIVGNIHPQSIITDIGGKLHTMNTNFYDEQQNISIYPALLTCIPGKSNLIKKLKFSEEKLVFDLYDIQKKIGITSKNKILICGSISNYSKLIGEILTALCIGMDIVFSSVKFDPVDYLYLICKYNISVIWTTSYMLKQLEDYAAGIKTPLKNIILYENVFDVEELVHAEHVFSEVRIKFVYDNIEYIKDLQFLSNTKKIF